MSTRRRSASLGGLAVLLATVALTGPAMAQEPPPEDLASELAAARERLAEAARDVARLSAEASAPTLESLQRRLGQPARRAMLGINIDSSEAGVLVTGVSPNGPAAEAGVQTGDLIVAIDGASVVPDEAGSASELLHAQLANVEPGDTVELTLVRDGEPRIVAVQAQPSGAWLSRTWQDFSRDWEDMASGFADVQRRALASVRPDSVTGRLPAVITAIRPFGRWQGLELVELTPSLGAYFGTEEGLLVVRAPEDNALGLVDGDVILAIGSRPPRSPEHAMRIFASFEPGETLEVAIMRQQQRQTLSVALPGQRQGRR
jgi:S1-C subfamily serine protease